MSGFRPYEPIGNSAQMDWARRVHREAFDRRRILTTPDALTSQTTQGVFHRPKAAEAEQEEATAQVIAFTAVWTLLEDMPNYGPGGTFSGVDVSLVVTGDLELLTEAQQDAALAIDPLIGAKPVCKLPFAITSDWTLHVGVNQSFYGQSNCPDFMQPFITDARLMVLIGHNPKPPINDPAGFVPLLASQWNTGIADYLLTGYTLPTGFSDPSESFLGFSFEINASVAQTHAGVIFPAGTSITIDGVGYRR